MKRSAAGCPPAKAATRSWPLCAGALEQPAADDDTREFQTLVGHFVLGMTLEIGNTFQDEFDQAARVGRRSINCSANLKKSPAWPGRDLGRSLFQVEPFRKGAAPPAGHGTEMEKAAARGLPFR